MTFGEVRHGIPSQRGSRNQAGLIAKRCESRTRGRRTKARMRTIIALVFLISRTTVFDCWHMNKYTRIGTIHTHRHDSTQAQPYPDFMMQSKLTSSAHTLLVFAAQCLINHAPRLDRGEGHGAGRGGEAPRPGERKGRSGWSVQLFGWRTSKRGRAGENSSA